MRACAGVNALSQRAHELMTYGSHARKREILGVATHATVSAEHIKIIVQQLCHDAQFFLVIETIEQRQNVLAFE